MGLSKIPSIRNSSYISEQEKKFAQTRKMSIHEGNFGVLSAVIADNYIAPFALALGANAFQVGIISSSGGFFAPLGQILGSHEMEKHSRKIVLFIGIFGQLILMGCFMLLAYFYQFQYISLEVTWILLCLYLIYVFCGGLMTPPWFSVMGDVVPENKRGRYFAKRNLLNNIVAVSVTLIIAFLLDWYEAINLIFFGFMLVFLVGFIARTLSFTLFNFHYYPAFEFQPTDHVSMKNFITELPKSNFGHFTIFVALLIFAQWISAPFFTVYMLVELNFSYTELIFINISLTLFGLFFFPLFGWLADKKGNVVLLRLGSVIIIFLPLMWLFLDTPTEILLGPQLFGGIGWTAFNLATANIIYDNIPAKKRGDYVAMYNFFLGIGIILGGLLGSIIVEYIPISFMRPILFIFLLSFIARGVIVILFLPKIKEVRKVEVKPIFNVKSMPVYKWLYDISMREHSRLKNLKPRKRNRNNNHS